MVNLNTKMAIKVTKGLICCCTISNDKSHKDHCLCGKFHTSIKKCTPHAPCCPTNTLHALNNGIWYIAMASTVASN